MRHHRQVFNPEGVRSYLIVLSCLAFLAIVLPTFSRTGGVGSASPMGFAFVIIASVGLFGIFLFLQEMQNSQELLRFSALLRWMQRENNISELAEEMETIFLYPTVRFGVI